jgi:excisionase family DNA binding protein
VSETRLTLDIPDEVIGALAEHVAARVGERLERPERSPWMDLPAAASYLGFSRDRLYKLTAAGAIPCRRQPGGQRLIFHRTELDRWLETTWAREGWQG